MAGIYLHIPFCKQACHYCDFHFSTNLSRKEEMVRAISQEITFQKNYLLGENVNSIYFGGGTPSLLNQIELKLLLTTIKENFTVGKDAEITLEANPDDLSENNLEMFFNNGINRLSIGIQTFNEGQLTFLNRAHNARQATQCVIDARKAGFKNISIDLIYGIKSPDHSIWEQDLAKAISLQPEHISSYCLTIEPKTVFGVLTKKQKMFPVEEEYAAVQFETLIQTLHKSGYEQYEISNFCKPGLLSRHNSNYWKQEKYLGVGPGAHSYNGLFRQKNIAHNARYIQALESSKIPFEIDELDQTAQINEYIMTSIRTAWGCDLSWIERKFGMDLAQKYKNYIHTLVANELVIYIDNTISLTNKGKLVADKITEDLFLV